MIWTLFGVIFVIYWIWGRSLGEPPMYPGELPIIGHMYRFFVDNAHFFENIKTLSKYCYEQGGVVRLNIGIENVYVVADPDDYFTVANTCLYKNKVYNFAKKWMGEGLLIGRVSVWKRHRKLLTPAFNQQALDNFMGVFNKQGRKLVSDMARNDGKSSFDHWKFMQRNALETICLTAMGIELDTKSALHDEYEKAVDKLFSTLMERFKRPWLFIKQLYERSDFRKMEDKLIQTLHNLSNTVLKQKKVERQHIIMTNDEKRTLKQKFRSFIDLLIDLGEDMFTDQEIREEVDTMIVTGYDTIASTLLFTLLLVGSHPKVQKKIIQELNTVFGKSDRDVEKKDLQQLVYLEAVLKEVMRLYPVAPAIGRWINKEVKLKNYTLHANTSCIILLYAINRHPMWGPDAEDFKPERWLNSGTLPKNPNAFTSFSVGKRNCFGKTYAMMSMKTVLVHFLRRYTVAADCTKTIFKLELLLKIESGGEISIQSRT